VNADVMSYHLGVRSPHPKMQQYSEFAYFGVLCKWILSTRCMKTPVQVLIA
jgi:hypothetical protein